MFLAEVDHMRRLVQTLLQVPDEEVFALVDCEEFTETSSEFHISKFRILFLFRRLPVIRHIILEIQVAPLDLRDRVLGGMVPHAQRGRIAFVKQPNQHINQMQILPDRPASEPNQ